MTDMIAWQVSSLSLRKNFTQLVGLDFAKETSIPDLRKDRIEGFDRSKGTTPSPIHKRILYALTLIM